MGRKNKENNFRTKIFANGYTKEELRTVLFKIRRFDYTTPVCSKSCAHKKFGVCDILADPNDCVQY